MWGKHTFQRNSFNVLGCSCFWVTQNNWEKNRRHDIQHNDTETNDTLHNSENCSSRYIRKRMFCYVTHFSSGNTNWRGRLCTINLLIEIGCFVAKLNNIFNEKWHGHNLLVKRRSTVLSLPLQQEFPAESVNKLSVVVLNVVAPKSVVSKIGTS